MRALALAAIVVLAGCGGDDDWSKTAGDTTCREWIDVMTIDQRHGLGEAMLAILWERDGASRTPPTDIVDRFADAVGGTCKAFPDEKVSTVGAGLYTVSDDVKP